MANPTLAVAKTRVDGYASGFIRGGAGAVIAEGTNSIGYYIDTIFSGHTTLDGIKYFTRAQMGRCQGGFCTYKIIKILMMPFSSN